MQSPETILILTISGVLSLAILIFFLRYFLRLKNKFSSVHNFAVLLLTIPKEDIPEEELSREGYIQKLISSAETLFANLGGMKAQRGTKSFFKGRSDHFSFEIVADREGLISFYAVIPRQIQQYFEQQIQAQYPDIQIEEQPDYNIFNPRGVILGANLVLKKDYALPIKTFMEMEVDSLNGLTNTLSQFDPREGAVIQIICRSSHPKWHSRGSVIAKEIQKGKTLNQALRSAGANGIFGKMFSSVSSFFQAGSGKTVWEKEVESQTKRPQGLSPMQEESLKKLEQKNSKAGLDVNIRLMVSTDTMPKAESYLSSMVNSFGQFAGYEYSNGFSLTDKGFKEKLVNNFIYRHFDEKRSFILNTEELASIFHLPLPMTETPNIRWLMAKKLPAATNIPKQGLLLGENVYRGRRTNIFIKPNDRRRHTYIIGQTGVGKSVLLSNLIKQDIATGQGVCVVDPHGDLVEEILTHIPKQRAEDVILFDPADTQRPIAINMLEYKTEDQKTFVINEMIAIFDKLYDLKATGGPMFEQYMRNAMLLIMDDKESGATLLEISKVLADEQYRKHKLSKVQNFLVKDFWEKEAQKAGGEASLANMVPYITSKLTPFTTNHIVRPIISQQKSAFDFRKAMDEKKIILLNLSKGKLGEMNSNLLGMIIIGKILYAAISRVNISEEERHDFYLYIDEFQNFTTESISVILSEARKYKLNLIVAHQFIAQLVKNQDTAVRDAIFGNVGTVISYRIGVDDAELLAKQLGPPVTEHDVINMEKFTTYVRLLVDNQATKPFNMNVFPPIPGNPELASQIKELSRLKYGRERSIVEEEIVERTRVGDNS